MSHYDVDYSGLTPQHKHKKALVDIVDYLGEERFHRVNAHYHELASKGVILTRDQFAHHLSIAGVSGYPVSAWYAEIWPYG